MKLSNFKLVISNAEMRIAEVDVTTSKWLFWSETTRRKIVRTHDFWSFADTGQFTPGLQAEELSLAWAAQEFMKKAA